MKRSVLMLLFTLSAAALSAQAMWSGNASVGEASDFPGTSEVYRAASNSFPTGQILKVINPRNGRSAEVTVVGRLNSPGVFILLEPGVGTAIGLPSDHVIPIRVEPLDSGSTIELADSTYHDGEITEDGDYNPLAGFDESAFKPREVVVEEPVKEAEPAEEPAEEPVLIVKDIPREEAPEPEEVQVLEADIPEEAPSPVIETEPIVPEDTGETEEIHAYVYPNGEVEELLADEIVDVTEPETILAFDLPVDEPEEEIPEKPLKPKEDLIEETDAALDAESSIFFLMPSDLRPPEPSVDMAIDTSEEEPEEVPAAVIENPEISSPVSIEPLNLPNAAAGPGSRYIQIGAFGSKAILEDSARQISSLAPGYPLSVAEEDAVGGTVYKLLIGPLKPAEVGSVMHTARTSLFPDAFPYNPQ